MSPFLANLWRKGSGRRREVRKGLSCEGRAEMQAFFTTPGPAPPSIMRRALGVQEGVGHTGSTCAHVCSMCHGLLLVSVLLLISECFRKTREEGRENLGKGTSSGERASMMLVVKRQARLLSTNSH